MTKTATQLKADFGWKPLVEIPDSVPSATFIDGNDAQEFLQEYNGRTEDYGDAGKRLRVLSLKDGVVKGSNPFAVALTDQMLRGQGIRVATMADLERGLETGALNLRGTYEDTGLVLRSEQNPNSYLAKNIAEQFRTRGHKVGETPLVVPLRGLNVVRDTDSNYGLAFELTDESQVIEAPQLVGSNSRRKFASIDENGLPVLDSEGDRTLYAINNGLSRLGLDGGLDLGSGGRVVLTRGEATDADILSKMYRQENSELSDRLQRAGQTLQKGMSAAYEAAVEELNRK
jgi:hypothetical protein